MLGVRYNPGDLLTILRLYELMNQSPSVLLLYNILHFDLDKITLR